MSFEIRTLEPGEIIRENGFYQIPLSRHHSQPCSGVSVTSGVLRRMEHHGPSKTWATHMLNPNRFEENRSDALRLGSAMAAFVEAGIDGLREHYQILPENRPDRPTRAQFMALKEGRESSKARASIAFWREVDRDPREYVTESEFEHIAAMGLALAADPSAGAVLGGMPEVTMAAYDEQTKLWLLSRPDNVHFDGTSSDYKKISTQGKPFTTYLVDRLIEKHGYDAQMAFASDVFERITGIWSNQAGLIFQEDTAPYDVILRPIPEEDLRIGQFLNRHAAIRFRECLDANDWPGPGQHIAPFNRNEKAREALLERMETSGVAP